MWMQRAEVLYESIFGVLLRIVNISSRLYLNFQPRGLRRDNAARYIGIGVTKFDELVRRGLLPNPVRIDGCVIWDVHSLDSAFDALTHPGDSNPWDSAS